MATGLHSSRPPVTTAAPGSDGPPHDLPARRQRVPLTVAVLATGTATMALQMCAVRLLAPAVGASSIVWATIIGLSLLAMSLGYVLGGRLADRRADGATLARALAVAALLTAAIPLVSPALLPHVTLGIGRPALADLVGAGVGHGLLFFLPALLLGVMPPYAIRLAMPRVGSAGRTAGSIYATSTVGSILGTLLTALVLVQWIGTRATIWVVAVLLLVAAALVRRIEPAVQRDGRAPTVPTGQVTPGVPSLPLVGPGIAAAIVLVEGMAMMATEMSVARLVAPFFGASHAVWAVIIATAMGSIAVGSRVGGRAADRWPTLPALVVLLAAAGLAVSLLPFLAVPVMRLSTGGIEQVDVPTLVGSFLATMLLLVVPVTLLGMVPPWALRLAVPDVARSGRTAGRLYALSTTGALVGTFATVLVLIPAIGTRRTMVLFGASMLALAIVLAARSSSRDRRPLAIAAACGLLVAALATAPTGLVKPIDGGRVLAEEESRYQFIQVSEDEGSGRRVLQLNEGWAVHSVWDPATVLTGGIWDHFAAVPSLLERPAGQPDTSVERSMLVIGSAGGTASRAMRELRPATRVTSVELDTEVTRIGRRWFELTGRVHASDGRPFLQRSDRQFDVIHVDAYRQPYIPFYLTTREFFELVRARLRPGGVLSINVGSTPDDQRINEAVAATMRAVFPTVVRHRAERFNELVVAIDERVEVEELRTRVAGSDLTRRGPRMQQVVEDLAAGMDQVDPAPRRVLTDDRAPVEWMTDRMIFGEAG